MAPLVELYGTDHESIVAYVCKTYGLGNGATPFGNPHRLRREDIARRLRLYRNEHRVDIERIIDEVYETDDYKQTIKKLIPVAIEQNVTQRIVNKVASLYDLPAVRLLADAQQQDRFATESERVRLDGIMRESHRLTMLCGEALIWQFDGADGKSKLRIVTPDQFDAIPHPNDSLVECALLIDRAPTTILQGEARAALPHYEIWDDTYRYLVNAAGTLVDATGFPVSVPIAHGLGRIPGWLLHFKEPTFSILDASQAADIESAHLGVALLEVMIMRLSKAQGERQPVLTGNLSAMAKGQSMNGEKPLLLPPEVVASVLEMKTDPDHYLKVKQDKVTSVGAAYGISYDEMTKSGSVTGGELAARRSELTELRNQSRIQAKRNERGVVVLMGFDADGMRTDFQEQAVPQDAAEKLSLHREKVKSGLDSPIAYLQREDPDLSREGAIQLLQSNIRDYALLMVWIRALNMPGAGDIGAPGQSPEANGAMGGTPSHQDQQPGDQPAVDPTPADTAASPDAASP